jgi:predicted GNAT superfamily acetyltransferase
MAAGETLADAASEVSVRVLHSHEEFQETLEVQRQVWGFADIELVPWRICLVAQEAGGLVLGAYLGGKMVGFSFALGGLKPGGRAYWHSHMTGVVPEHQNRQVGRLIKLKQRQEAIRAGVGLIEWTYDPLEIRNAHFNTERLGSIVRRYVPNQYGITTSRLNFGLPTDRLVAEWHVASPRVAAVVDRGEPLEKNADAEIEVPGNIDDIRRDNPPGARLIQTRVREQFLAYLREGFVVVGFRRGEQNSAYLMGKPGEQPPHASW